MNTELRRLSDDRTKEVTELRCGITDLQKSLKETREKDVCELQRVLKSLQDADAERTKELKTLREELKQFQGRPR